MTEEKTKKTHSITIITENCKGCGICVEFCPTHTLGLKKGKVVVVNPESCTGCQLCDLRCPDFAIMVDNEFAVKFMKNKPQQPEAQKDED
jgi:2-oxoglutarate ferredoxin oxidoreductase subunit delta